jgi:hypothetical protein
VQIIGVALVLEILYWRRKRYLVEHLVFSAHYLSFAFLLSLAFWPIYAIYGFHPGPLQRALAVLSIGIILVYLYLAQRRFYGQGRGIAIMKTVLLWLGIYAVTVLLLAGSLIAAVLQLR